MKRHWCVLQHLIDQSPLKCGISIDVRASTLTKIAFYHFKQELAFQHATSLVKSEPQYQRKSG